jgi:putative DNA primase/helicase
MSGGTDWNDVGAAEGLETVRQGVNEAEPAVTPPEWPDPHLPGLTRTPEIPASLLPTWLGEMAGAIAESTQTPPALAVMSCLSVLATVLHGRFEVSPFGDGYVEPLPLWTLGAAPSGARKTAVQSAALAPIVYWEKLQRDRMRVQIARANSLRAVAKKRVERLLGDAAKAKSDDEREAIRAEIQREEEDTPEEARAPRLFTGDTTAERAQALLVEHGGRMAIHTDEAGQLGVMAGIYSNGQANLDVFLQSHAGSPLRVDRAGRSAHIDKPVMSIGLLLQPGVLAEAAGSKRFRDSGLLARFLYVMPASNVGSRDVRRHVPIPPGVREAYESKLFHLLEGVLDAETKPTVLPLSDDARERWYVFAEHVERNQGDGGRYESISDWTSKLPGAVARIAALFELATVGTAALIVGDASMASAVSLAKLLIPHAQAAFGLLGTDSIDVDGAAILKWVRGAELQEFKRSECQKAMEGRFRNVERLVKALQRLEQQDVLREFKVRNKGAPPSTWYRVNPKALSTTPTHSH